jgi:hypothetical protein
MNKICTSIEQSKKLIELGIDEDTSDMVYLRSYFEDEGKYNLLVGSYHEGYAEKDDGTLVPVFDEHIPAWSLTALWKLMPTKDKSNEYYVTTESHSDYHQVNYVNCWDGVIHETDSDDCLIDAAFEMVVWLKKNNKI